MEDGWELGADCIQEFHVLGMPNSSGTGSVDYVLLGDNGLPLAVVEAKKNKCRFNRGKPAGKALCRLS